MAGAAESLVELEMRLAESQAESHHLHEMVHILGKFVYKQYGTYLQYAQDRRKNNVKEQQTNVFFTCLLRYF